jgi:hypothetical protein
MHQRLRHQHAALHASGKLAHIGIGLVGKPRLSSNSSIQASLFLTPK